MLVVWPDSRSAVREPDRQYATILTDGAVIELAADGAVYRYHAGGDTDAVPVRHADHHAHRPDSDPVGCPASRIMTA